MLCGDARLLCVVPREGFWGWGCLGEGMGPAVGAVLGAAAESSERLGSVCQEVIGVISYR